MEEVPVPEEAPVSEEKPAYAFPVFHADSPVKQISVASDAHRCLFCKTSEVDELHIGPLYYLPEDKVTVHYFCLLFSAGLEQHGHDREGILGFLPDQIFKEVRRASRLKCVYCGINGASIGCNTGKCKASFHYPCGLANDANFQFIKNYQSYCKNHRQCADFKVPDDHNCPICYNPIENQRPVCGSCCKTAIFHKDCIQKQALSSGYFFKCPTCNSLKNFHYETKIQGIYVPEQDASWERDPDAFQELYQQYEHCDSVKCECPKGRNYGANKGAWLLARCRVCGSAGTHRQCGKLSTIANWACNSCLDFEARCAAKKVVEESIVKAPKVLVVTSSIPSRPSENGVPSPPTIVEKRKRIRTGRKPPQQIRKKPQFKSPPPPIKTIRGKKEKPVLATPEPKNDTELKKSRKRKTETIIQKRTYKRRKRNDLTPEDIEWLDSQEEEASVDLSKVHIGSASGDFFPYSKKKKKNFAVQGLECFPDWRGYSLKVQVVNIFLDLVDPVLPQDSIQKTEAKVTKPVLTDTANKKNVSKVPKQVLADTAFQKSESKLVESISADTVPKKNGKKVVDSIPTGTAPRRNRRVTVKAVTMDTAPKRSGRKAVMSVPTDIIPKESERNVEKSVQSDTIAKKSERKTAKSISEDAVNPKNDKRVAKSVATTIAMDTTECQSTETLSVVNSTKNSSTSKKTPTKRGRRKRGSKWKRGVVKKKKTVSAKAKAALKSKDASILENSKTVAKKSDTDKPASASNKILEGIRRSQESLLQFRQGKSTIKSTDEQSASSPSDQKLEQNGVPPKIDEIVGSKRKRPSQRVAVSENEGKPVENGDKNTTKIGPSKSDNTAPNDRSCNFTNESSTTSNEETVKSSSDVSDSRLPAQSNGNFQRRASGMRACDKPVIKVEVEAGHPNNEMDNNHGDDFMDTSDASNGHINMAQQVHNTALGIARDLLQHPNRSEAHEKLRLLEEKCPQLFQNNAKK